MNRLLWTTALPAALLGLSCGCVEPSSVIVEKRKVPVYPQTVRPVPSNVRVAIYPAAEVGDAETRALRQEGYEALASGMRAAGYDVMPAAFQKTGSRDACIVEVAECRHDMPERDRDGGVSLVTVVAVRVRRPVQIRNGRGDCGVARSFQGVYRMELGAKPWDFHVSDAECARGVKGAVANLIGAEQFRNAVVECGKVHGISSVSPSGGQ